MPQRLFISQLPAWPGGRGRQREDLDQERPDRREGDAWPRDRVPGARLQRWRSWPSTALVMVWGGVGVRMAGARADRTSETSLPSPVPGRGGEAGEGEGIGRRRTLLPLTAGLDPLWHPAAGSTARLASSTTPFRVTRRVHAQARRRLRVPPWPTTSVAKQRVNGACVLAEGARSQCPFQLVRCEATFLYGGSIFLIHLWLAPTPGLFTHIPTTLCPSNGFCVLKFPSTTQTLR